ncbi:homeobox protein NANOG [Clupea harengus]|uniref:Homeobox protein NANOG n=1 Tax=Clupea harengus TaxID=7950 RepID=A0A6P3VH36_CLUHA|nr:homeobox protein NANOG [Clupea harengus]
MADWKVPVSYNFNPSYHAYAYGLLYQAGSEQTHPNLNWTEATYNHPGVNGGYYQTQPPHQSPPASPGQVTSNSTAQYPGPMLYFSDTHTQSGRLFLSQNRNIAHYEDQTKESERPSSDNPSDSEAHTPDSWSSGSSREVCIPPGNPATWIKKDTDDETVCGSPDGTEVVSSSITVGDDDPSLKDVRSGQGPVNITQSPPAQTTQTRKAKVRTAFSEGQMNALTHRFSMQRYLTPAEMKTLAGLTGLTYKQVKTWFQNRRMKLKRHQKENGWVSERYANSGYSSVQPASHSQFQADSQALLQDPYSNPQLREAVFKKSPPQPAGFYPNYLQPHSPPQATGRPRGNWPLPNAMTHYEYPSPANFMPHNGNTSINSDDGNGVDVGSSPTHMAMVHSATQWSS